MRALIIDDNYAYLTHLKKHLKVIFNPINHGLDDLNYSSDSVYLVAAKLSKAAGNAEDLLIFINIDLKLENFRRQHQSGVDILKYLRLVESFSLPGSTIRISNHARDTHCVLYSLRSRQQLLKQKPESLIISSEGTSFVRLPSDFSQLDFKQAIQSKANIDSLEPYFRIDLTVPDDRHDWANWWGIRQLYEVQKRVEANPKMRYPQNVSEKSQNLRSKQAIFLYGRNSQHLDAAFKNLENRIGELRTQLGERVPRILHIDDRWKDGWSAIFMKMIYEKGLPQPVQPANESLPYKDFAFRNRSLFRVVTSYGDGISPQLKPEERFLKIRDGVSEAIKGFGPHLILLDLRLLGETGTRYDVASLSGARILKWLRDQYQSIPIIMTTASNKVWTLEKLLQVGADAFWVKEGLDERRSAEETVRNYCRILELTEKTTAERYDFLNRFDLGRLALFQQPKLWWENHQWNDSFDPGRVTQGSRTEVASCLADAVLMLRSYLQQYELGYGYENQIQERNWAAAILRQAAYVIEEVHNLDPSNPSNTGTRGLIGGYTEKGTGNDVIRRADWFAYELYGLRNEASHRAGSQNITWEVLKPFLAHLICYLRHGPQSRFREIGTWEITGSIKSKSDIYLGRLAKLRKLSTKYNQLFQKLTI